MKQSQFIIFGVPLSQDKQIKYALIQLYGIGKTRAQQICRELGLIPQVKTKDLTERQEFLIAKQIKDHFTIEGNLEEQQKLDLNHHQTSGSQRGYRLRHGLPVRGQRTHSNGKTARKRLFNKKL